MPLSESDLSTILSVSSCFFIFSVDRFFIAKERESIRPAPWAVEANESDSDSLVPDKT